VTEVKLRITTMDMKDSKLAFRAVGDLSEFSRRLRYRNRVKASLLLTCSIWVSFDNLHGGPVRSSSVRTREAMVESLFSQIKLKDGAKTQFWKQLTEVEAVSAKFHIVESRWKSSCSGHPWQLRTKFYLRKAVAILPRGLRSWLCGAKHHRGVLPWIVDSWLWPLTMK
jgi:hypothetical protein